MKRSPLLFLMLPLLCVAQTVINKPAVVISLGDGTHPIILNRGVVQGDTVYSFIFRNRKYEVLTDVKDMRVNKKGLTALIKGLAAAQSASMGDYIMMPDFSISKEKLAFGGARYWFRYDNGYCYLSDKDIKKLLNAIQGER